MLKIKQDLMQKNSRVKLYLAGLQTPNVWHIFAGEDNKKALLVNCKRNINGDL